MQVFKKSQEKDLITYTYGKNSVSIKDNTIVCANVQFDGKCWWKDFESLFGHVFCDYSELYFDNIFYKQNNDFVRYLMLDNPNLGLYGIKNGYESITDKFIDPITNLDPNIDKYVVFLRKKIVVSNDDTVILSICDNAITVTETVENHITKFTLNNKRNAHKQFVCFLSGNNIQPCHTIPTNKFNEMTFLIDFLTCKYKFLRLKDKDYAKNIRFWNHYLKPKDLLDTYTFFEDRRTALYIFPEMSEQGFISRLDQAYTFNIDHIRKFAHRL